MTADERDEELSTLAAIYPELVIPDLTPHQASIEIAVAPVDHVVATFESSLDRPPTPPHSEDGNQPRSHTLEYLPPLRVKVMLPPTYPDTLPPQVSLDSLWLPADTLRRLESECTDLWSEYGQCQILFTYFDHLQQAAERLFDLPRPLVVPSALEPALINFDAERRKDVFEAGTYDCGVCLEPKRGTKCHMLDRCAHVFCRACLHDYYNNAITEGDVVKVKCLDLDCGKDPARRRGRKTLHPRELFAIGIEPDMVRRYVEMKRKKKAESNKETVYCPRTWCQAPSRRFTDQPIPDDLADYPDSEPDVDLIKDVRNTDGLDEAKSAQAAKADRIEICSQCEFAFCNVCFAGWHGEFARCFPRDPKELSPEDQASYDYMRQHTSPCPSCGSGTQKSHGCNHMICYTCKTHFCYLCSAWLFPSDPYKHYNTVQSSCYMRLWEGEEGVDGVAPALEADDLELVDDMYELGLGAPPEGDQHPRREPHEEIPRRPYPDPELLALVDRHLDHAQNRIDFVVGVAAAGQPAAEPGAGREPAPVPAAQNQGQNQRGHRGGRRPRGGRQAGHVPGEGPAVLREAGPERGGRRRANRGAARGGGRPRDQPAEDPARPADAERRVPGRLPLGVGLPRFPALRPLPTENRAEERIDDELPVNNEAWLIR